MINQKKILWKKHPYGHGLKKREKYFEKNKISILDWVILAFIYLYWLKKVLLVM